MSTPHNKAELGQIAKTVLMPGDPLRAKFIAETFLEDPVLVNDVRGMLGYTGTYQGKQVSVMGSGMGMPSIGIYSHELYAQYGVESIIRIGSAGSYTDKAKLYDVVLATAAYSEADVKAAEAFGRVDDNGTVFVKDGDAEREVGQFPDVSKEEALALYARRFLDLKAKLDLLATRLASPNIKAREIDESVKPPSRPSWAILPHSRPSTRS